MSIVKKIFLYLFVIVYGFAFAEYFIRIFEPQALIPRYIEASNYGIRANVPNAVYQHVTPEVDVRMTINSVGMRDNREFSLSKPEELCRVGIFGDSFFMSYEVSLEDSFAKALESELKSAGRNCEVLNFAVSGFGTAESIIQFENFAVNYDLDYAVLEWHHTDVADNFRSGLYRVNNGDVIRHAEQYLPGVATRERLMQYGFYRWMIQYSHLYTAGREKLATIVKGMLVDIKKTSKSLFSSSTPVQTPKAESVVNTKAKPAPLDLLLVNKFDKVAAEYGVKTVLLDVPARTFDGEIESSFDHLDGRERVMPLVCSPYQDLVKLNKQDVKLFFEQGHKHFTPVGYAALAKSASGCIVEGRSNYPDN